jgi:GTP-binding protein LepA
MANVYLALDSNLEIIPVINKIDLPAADPDKVIQEVESTIGLSCEDAIRCSAKVLQALLLIYNFVELFLLISVLNI